MRKAANRKSGSVKVRSSADARRNTDAPAVAPPRSVMRRERRLLKTAELIARDIILDISEGGLKTGDPLPPEASMLQQYEVGRASLREALRMLEVQGLVRIRPGAKGGPIVGAATAESLARMLTLFFGLAGATYENLTDVMLILFPKVAEEAANRKLTRADIQQINASLDQSCGAQPSRLAKTEVLQDFHLLLPTLSGNSVWTLLMNAVSAIFTEHVMSTIDSRGFHQTAIDDHREIAEAIIARNPEKAGKAMLEHTERMITFYRSQNPAIFSQLIEWR